jgi:hypothetical protein
MRQAMSDRLTKFARSCGSAALGIAIYGVPVTLALMTWKH